MNNYESSESESPPPPRIATQQELALSTNNPILSDQWEEGLIRYGHAFAAYARLNRPDLHSTDVLVRFHKVYEASYPNMQTCIQQEVIQANWESAYRHLLDLLGISEQMLRWDFDALEALIRDVYAVVEEGGEVHLFAK